MKPIAEQAGNPLWENPYWTH